MYDYVKFIYHGDVHKLKDELRSFNVKKITANHRDVYFDLGGSLGLGYRIRTREIDFFAPVDKRAAFKNRVFDDLEISSDFVTRWAADAGKVIQTAVGCTFDEEGRLDQSKPFLGTLVQTLYVNSYRPGLIEFEGGFSDH